MSDIAPKLARWRSHKLVRAARILGFAGADHASTRMVLELADGETAEVAPASNMFVRYQPVAGDYYVVYDDDYASISPAKAFEEGYDRIEV